MAVMTYKQFLAALGRRGFDSTSNATNAAKFKLWQSQQPEAQAATQTNVDATNVPTALSPEDLNQAILKDPNMIDQALAAQRDYKTGGATALANWQNARNQLAAQLPQFQHQLELNQLNAARGGAARGTYASGQTELDRQTAATDYANQVSQNQLQAQAADTAYQQQGNELESQYNQNYGGAYRNAAQNFIQNRLSDFSNTYGIGSGVGANVPSATNVAAAQPSSGASIQTPAMGQPRPTVAPKPTWAQFVASHGTPTGAARTTLAAKYKQRFA